MSYSIGDYLFRGWGNGRFKISYITPDNEHYNNIYTFTNDYYENFHITNLGSERYIKKIEIRDLLYINNNHIKNKELFNKMLEDILS